RCLLLGHFHLVVAGYCDMRALNNFVKHLLLFFLLNSSAGLVPSAARRRKRVIGWCTFADQNVTGVYLLFRFAVLCFSLAIFKLDDVITKLRLNQVADLSLLKCKSCLLKLRHHLPLTKPA